ncbi:hypothetical protein P8452_04314 [Trifolium repens]|nr:hypothetical protein P8452_04314 [Trifolium repens]
MYRGVSVKVVFLRGSDYYNGVWTVLTYVRCVLLNQKMNCICFSPDQIGQQSFGGWQAWLEAQQMRRQHSNAEVVPPWLSWVRPLEGWLKCNVDG